MWARHIEAVIGLWLFFSWLIFSYSDEPNMVNMRVNDWICACLIFVFSLSSYWEPCRYSHLLNFLVGIWLVIWVIPSDKSIHFAPNQNYVFLGLLLLMLALVPSRTKEPPKAWIEYLKAKNKL